MDQVVSTVTGHSFCEPCFRELAVGDGAALARFIPEERERKTVVGLRSKQKVDVTLQRALELLFAPELALLRPSMRRHATRNEPLDGRKPLRLARSLKPKAPVETFEEMRERKKRQEAERIEVMKSAGKDVYDGDRENKNMPDISHLMTRTGAPMVHLRSCHVCTQGNASWRGGFFQPIGCSKCPNIFCPRCLGHILGRPYTDEANKKYVDEFIKEFQMTYVCRCCENTCACQDPKFGPAAIVSSNATGAYALTFCTSVPHPFQVGDKIRIANHQIGKAKGAANLVSLGLRKGEWAIAATPNKTSFVVQTNTAKEASTHLKLASGQDKGAGGTAEMIKLQKHKRLGWVGASGTGLVKEPLAKTTALNKPSAPKNTSATKGAKGNKGIKAPGKGSKPPAKRVKTQA